MMFFCSQICLQKNENMIDSALSQSRKDRVFVSRQQAVNLFTHPVTVTSTRSNRLTAFCIGDKAMDNSTGGNFGPRMDQQVRLRVFERDNYTCRYCGNKTGPFHADHVYPYSKGGETSMNNLVTACKHCNISKHNKVGKWPKPIGYFEEKQKIYKDGSREAKEGGALIFLNLLSSGIVVSFLLVYPNSSEWMIYKIAVWGWLIYTLLVGANYVYEFLKDERGDK